VSGAVVQRYDNTETSVTRAGNIRTDRCARSADELG